MINHDFQFSSTTPETPPQWKSKNNVTLHVALPEGAKVSSASWFHGNQKETIALQTNGTTVALTLPKLGQAELVCLPLSSLFPSESK